MTGVCSNWQHACISRSDMAWFYSAKTEHHFLNQWWRMLLMRTCIHRTQQEFAWYSQPILLWYLHHWRIYRILLDFLYDAWKLLRNCFYLHLDLCEHLHEILFPDVPVINALLMFLTQIACTSILMLMHCIGLFMSIRIFLYFTVY